MNDYFMSDESQEEKIHLRDVLEQYLNHWKWFVLGVFLCFVIAFLYLRYTTPQYQASTTILVKDEKKGGMLSELSAFADMGLGSAMKSNLDNEVEILRSRSLIESTVKKLELNISIFEKGRVNTRELYEEAPIEVHFTNVKPSFYTDGMKWEFVKLSPNTFELVSAIDEETPVLLTNKKEFRYGEVIPTINGGLIISKSIEKNQPKNLEDKSIFIVVIPFDKVVASYQRRLVVDPISKTSSVVSISLTDPIFERAEVFLDNLIQIYNDDAAADKNFISENTSKFISSRLILITQELDGVEKDVESFNT